MTTPTPSTSHQAKAQQNAQPSSGYTTPYPTSYQHPQPQAPPALAAFGFSSTEQPSRSASPPRPRYSPISPPATLAQLSQPNGAPHRIIPPPLPEESSLSISPTSFFAAPAQPAASATFIQPPESLPIDESSNTDAAALRAAISILQIQKEKSKRDIQTLQKLKQQAAADPQRFTQHLLQKGTSQKKDSVAGVDILAPTLAQHYAEAREEDDEDDRDNDTRVEDPNAIAEFPQPQNIIRMPPVNWAKYQVVGESLDKLHDEQRQRPTLGEPSRDPRAAIHVIAAPYSPFSDRLTEGQHPMQTRRTSKRPA